ncbi:MAG: 3-deoxy-7-phosphoheptulonate synthase [Flavobacteriales bacterium]|nr:3-deoxy-7-phosphoheptulonate synthase [Flavobacteriales bacterium]MCX7768057.1 3-deoxy-7-phosphoheptulonate synthase [Flavobacteriales bacterium]MDW8409262.1 3-deoxy-7-phosphoheptulonate synthase [Flavobacteriales bacterium]
MIIRLKQGCDKNEALHLAAPFYGILVQDGGEDVLVISGKIQELPSILEPFAEEVIPTEGDFQLSARRYRNEKRAIKLSSGLTIGGTTTNCVLMIGPCSVEEEEQIEAVAQFCVAQGIRVLRAGAFKPRTAPYSFQGLGLEGLKLLARMREKYGLLIITEARDATHIEAVIEHSDIVQVGAKAMYDHGILKACGKARKPVLIKRGFGSTLQELVQASEFVLSAGNEQVMLCERGIRTFETKTRFTLDLCGVAWLKEHCNLPIILDPSHAMGYAYGVPDLARACLAMGVDGLLVEVHPFPAKALSDSSQQLNFEQFARLKSSLIPLAQAIGITLI